MARCAVAARLVVDLRRVTRQADVARRPQRERRAIGVASTAGAAEMHLLCRDAPRTPRDTHDSRASPRGGSRGNCRTIVVAASVTGAV